ncbi:MAG TPA: DUF2892 domain-containing protein [Desulfohalobiaceae bacterium]|nr:DUF2892 domain-containing protein [Desulfohalobiaceae bacterium]
MDMHRIVRGVAGAIVLISLFLAVVFSNWWLLVTLFVGVNLFQSAFTDNCPLMAVLRKTKSP